MIFYAKKTNLLICILVLSISFSSSVYANTFNTTNESYSLNTKEGSTTSQLWIYILDVWQTFDISNSGKAEIVTTMDTKNSEVDSLKVVSNLQQLKDGFWTTIKSWTSTIESTSLILQKSWYVSKGYFYRLVTNYYAYSGLEVETTSIISRIVGY